jgi:hypothetical protein
MVWEHISQSGRRMSLPIRKGRKLVVEGVECMRIRSPIDVAPYIGQTFHSRRGTEIVQRDLSPDSKMLRGAVQHGTLCLGGEEC